MVEIGKIYQTRNYGDLRVIEIRSSIDVDVEFIKTGYRANTRSWLVETGQVKDKLFPSFYDVGYLGDGPFSHKNCRVAYKRWKSMLARCYDKNSHKYEMYGKKGVRVCEDWYNFQTYARWFTENYIEGFQIDKDLRKPNSKTYSPETCSFVPQEVNVVLSQRAEPKHCVYTREDCPKRPYRVCINRVSVGHYSSEQEALRAYKYEKSKRIEELLIKYQTVLHAEVINTLTDWKKSFKLEDG